MPTPTTFATLHASVADVFPGVASHSGGKNSETLHLYHAPNSLCSQKVRTTLAHLGRRYQSHLINIFEGENYHPAYVRLRMAGCADAGLSLADQHLGSTSVANGGCDACVVPTLVDTQAEKIVVDSHRICQELDRGDATVPGRLMPEPLRTQIEAELTIIDNLPNYQILAMGVGALSDKGIPNGFSLNKVARCDALLAEHADDAVLCTAYAAKRSKEKMAAEQLFDEASLLRAYTEMANTVRELELRTSPDNRYLFGDTPTLADLFWGVELLRFEDLGLAVLWERDRLPRVARYFETVQALPSINHAIINWPNARLPRRPNVNLRALSL